MKPLQGVVGLSRGTFSFDILCLNEIWIFSLISVWKGLERLSLSPFLLGYLVNSPYKKSTFGPVEAWIICSPRKYPYRPPLPLRTAMEIPGEGGSNRTQFPKGWGVASRGLFSGAQSKTGEISKTNILSVEQASSYCTVNGLKIRIVVLIDDILLTVVWILFFTAYATESCYWHLNQKSPP